MAYKKKSGWNFWSVMGVIFLVVIIAGGAVALAGYFLGWYNNDDTTTEIEEVEDETDHGYEIPEDNETNDEED